MPYKCVPRGNKFELINKETGKQHGTHDDLHSCIRQMRLLYRIEGGEKPTGAKGKPFRVHPK